MRTRTGLVLAGAVALAAVTAALLLTGLPSGSGEPDVAEHRETIADPLTSDHWSQARNGDQGVTVWDPRHALRGFTLYSTGDGASAHLVTMIGQEVQHWSLPYSAVWNRETAAVQDPQPDELVFFRWVHLFPDGDLLASYAAAGHTPSGYGLVKMDKDSRPIWSYLQRVEGAFDVGPDGRIYAAVQDFGKNERGRRILDDLLVVLSPDGKEISRQSIGAAVRPSSFRQLILAPGGGPLDVDSVDVITPDTAPLVPGAKPGDVLLSFPRSGAVAVFDPSSNHIVWAAHGPWAGQHDATLVAGGGILAFDNGGGTPDANGARVIEASPPAMDATWRYAAASGQPPLASAARSAARRLANGNTLITESDAGRIIEVTKDGTIVWDYMNPLRGGPDDGRIPIVTAGQRILSKDLDPAFRGSKRP